MTKKKSVVIDCDDVLVSCNEFALNLLNKQTESHFKLSDIDKWGLMGNGLDARLRFFSDPRFVRSQPVYAGAKEFLQDLSKIANVTIATCVPMECAEVRKTFIRENFPGMHSIIAQDKSNIVADIMLDDNPMHLKTTNCRYPILFRMPWNLEETEFRSVSSYNEFLSFVREVI